MQQRSEMECLAAESWEDWTEEDRKRKLEVSRIGRIMNDVKKNWWKISFDILKIPYILSLLHLFPKTSRQE